MNLQLYRAHDDKTQAKGMFPVQSAEEAKRWNDQGWGIFHAVQEFHGVERRIENLKRIRFWAIDMDEGDKPSMIGRIRKGLRPSLVVETARGYHVYFAAVDAKPQHWRTIVQDRLIPFYRADKNAKDLARVLRTPGFNHMKDPKNPFLVKTIFEGTALGQMVSYTEEVMAYFYPDTFKEERKEFADRQARDVQGTTSEFWEAVFRMDCEEALSRLSGHWSVGGEEYGFRRNRNGNRNLLVNGKESSCFIDRDGKIGSSSGGGPSVYQWLRWFKHSPADCARIIKEVFPELNREGGVNAR